jgi:uncharacterized membrane protein
MAVLPAGFTLPPLPYLLALVAGVVAVGWLLWRRRPPVTDRTVVALAPWMVAGSASHVLYVVEALPPALAPLAGTPAVYVSVAVLAGAVWLAADRVGDGDPDATARLVGALGLVALVPPVAAALLDGSAEGSLRLFWPSVGLLASVVLTAAGWVVLRRLRPEVTTTALAGPLAVFGHVLDGVSTAVGVDILGFGERSPLSRLIIEFAAGLPTGPVLGGAWLFVVVKLLLAGVIVVMLADFVEESPTEDFLLLGFVAAVGLGPGAHNLLLFTVA